ncbi:MAG: histidine kinase, partial [Bacteroidota bacterium]
QQVLFKNYTDSVLNLDNATRIAQLEMEYQYREEKLSAKLKEEQLILENKETKESLLQVKSHMLWLVIGILILLLFLVYILMSNSVRSLKLRTRNALTEQKLLRSQMTPHFMFNSLSVLQGIILSKEYDKSLRYLSRFSGLLRLTLENSRTTLVLLGREIAAIEQYLIVQNIARKIPFTFEITLEEAIDQARLLIPPMLIQPFVENAVRHGFREMSDQQHIAISFRLFERCLECKIVDNGVGFETHRTTSKRTDASISTDLIRERLALLSAEFKAELGVRIQQLDNGQTSGTRVLVSLPYKTQSDNETADSRR